jgi:hypothetical protein
MSDYGKPQTFTLDYQQMNQLFELLEREMPPEGSKSAENHPLECLRALRNDLYRRLD